MADEYPALLIQHQLGSPLEGLNLGVGFLLVAAGASLSLSGFSLRPILMELSVGNGCDLRHSWRSSSAWVGSCPLCFSSGGILGFRLEGLVTHPEFLA